MPRPLQNAANNVSNAACHASRFFHQLNKAELPQTVRKILDRISAEGVGVTGPVGGTWHFQIGKPDAETTE